MIQTVIKDKCSEASCYQGVYPEVLLLLQSKLNFTFKILKSETFGYKHENGSWAGMIGK